MMSVELWGPHVYDIWLSGSWKSDANLELPGVKVGGWKLEVVGAIVRFSRPQKTNPGKFGVSPGLLKNRSLPFFPEKLVSTYVETNFPRKPFSLPFNWLSIRG